MSLLDRFHADPGRYPRYNETLDDVCSLDWSDLHADNGADKPDAECVLIHRYLSFGDYDNSCAVERANVRVFRVDIMERDDTPAGVFFDVSGAYGSEAIAIRADYQTRLASHPDILADVQSVLSGLEDYPAISDEAVSETELDLETEAWESDGASDFQDAIEREYAPWADALADAAASYDALYTVWRALDDDGALSHIESGGVVYFDVERAVERITPEHVCTLLGIDVSRDDTELFRMELWNDGRAAERRLHALGAAPAGRGFVFGDDSQIYSVRAFEQYAEAFPEYLA